MKENGNGLGLATVHAIIAKHKGYITVQSVLGVETTVSVYIPACAETEPTASEINQQLQTGSGRILVLDDEEAVCQLLEEVLKRLGYQVECAKDGAKAIEQYERAKALGHGFSAVHWI